METLNKKEGSVSIIGAVSPQGADFSEPVTQNTKRFVRSFWALDKQLAYARHYAAINWNTSYSEYVNDLTKWYDTNVGPSFLLQRKEIMALLAEENKLLEIVKLIGADVLPDDQKLIIEIGKVIRFGYLQQNAFHKDDTYVPLEKQNHMMEVILYLYKKAKNFVDEGKSLNLLIETSIFDDVIKMKYDVPNNELNLFDQYFKSIDKMIKRIK
jgi:V/A-type H+-transporting ATPase subunit A